MHISLPSHLLLASLPLTHAQETILGLFIFHRHGDRTSKSFAPTTLTDLGYAQVHQSGSFFRDRYVDSNAILPVYGISSSVVKNSQLKVEAPVDTVLQNSAVGFLQGLYPPVGAGVETQSLANGSRVLPPLGGYQLIPVNSVASASSGADSENSAWLQGQSGCGKAMVSSNNYFYSNEYFEKLSATTPFYQSIFPVINRTFTSAANTYFNAYSIYDLIHVSQIHNTSIPSSDLLTPSTLHQLQTLADSHEFNLAYNTSDPIRAIAGRTLAAQIVQNLNSTLTSKSKTPLTIQFGAYASFLSFFGLSQLRDVSENFTGVVDYASSMVFELITNATVSNTSYPSMEDISVRFLFANGSAYENPLNEYPLFGGNSAVIPWRTFTDEMGKFAIGDQESWCRECGNNTGVCAPVGEGVMGQSGEMGGKKEGVSRVVAGVIGAMVTLAVVLGVEGLVLLVGGLRVVRKRGGSGSLASEGAVKA
ncbi:hypothetical protein HYALB_00007232 [Hymenoscyphus albidus]|uniref:Uncharacterized protein n=1 Tax=Hymenoscyphus albidus TaxID=595503 RepID=A0A9N9LFQ3_9HELO|nr:hypothetical protein HYALB_00007232 [Hymenoscyphus albidus]